MVGWGKGGKIKSAWMRSVVESSWWKAPGKAEDTLETQRHMANEVTNNARSSKASALKVNRRLLCPC